MYRLGIPVRPCQLAGCFGPSCAPPRHCEIQPPRNFSQSGPTAARLAPQPNREARAPFLQRRSRRRLCQLASRANSPAAPGQSGAAPLFRPTSPCIQPATHAVTPSEAKGAENHTMRAGASVAPLTLLTFLGHGVAVTSIDIDSRVSRIIFNHYTVSVLSVLSVALPAS